MFYYQTLQEFFASLPWPMLRQMAVQDPVEAAGAWIWVPVALWCIPLIAAAAPRMFASASGFWRGRDGQDKGFATVFLISVLFVASWAFPSRAQKGGGGETNNPPATVDSPTKSIRLYYTDSNGHLVPLGAQIQGVNP